MDPCEWKLKYLLSNVLLYLVKVRVLLNLVYCNNNKNWNSFNFAFNPFRHFFLWILLWSFWLDESIDRVFVWGTDESYTFHTSALEKDNLKSMWKKWLSKSGEFAINTKSTQNSCFCCCCIHFPIKSAYLSDKISHESCVNHCNLSEVLENYGISL